MPDPYKMISEANGYDQKSMDGIAELKLTPNIHLDMMSNGGQPIDCPGLQLLEDAKKHAFNQYPLLALFWTFTSPKYSGKWTWQGSAGGSNFGGLLDPGAHQKTTGECLHFVKNFYLLCRAPAPYGLGMKNDKIKIVVYDGNGQGFVSKHDKVYLTLPSNVASAPSYNGPPLYNWANHKVLHVPDLNLYLDPCYCTTYNSLAEMALYVTELSKDSYERARRDGRFHYFVERSPSEKASDPTKKYKGPFTETEFEILSTPGQIKVK